MTTGCPASGKERDLTPASNGVLRIVSWNIRAGGGRRVDQIANAIERWGADVAALSEFRATPPSLNLAARLEALGLRHQISTADSRMAAANRLLIASRRPLSRVNLRNAPKEPGLWALTEIAASRPFSMGAMHIPNRVSGRKYSYHEAILRLARGWRRGPALIVGDTNSGRIGIDEEAPVFSKGEEKWMVALERLGWRDGFRFLYGDTRVYTWYSPNGQNGFRLDEAFVNRHLISRLLDTRYEWALPAEGDGRRDAVSDHAALIVDLAA